MIKAGLSAKLTIGCGLSNMSRLDGVHFVCMRRIKRFIEKIC